MEPVIQCIGPLIEYSTIYINKPF